MEFWWGKQKGALPHRGAALAMSALNSPDQLGMIIPFSKEIIGPAGVFVHVFTCPDCFKAGAEWCRLEATNAAYRLYKIGGCDIESVSHTFGNLKFLCSSGLLVRKLTNIWMERTLIFFVPVFSVKVIKLAPLVTKKPVFRAAPIHSQNSRQRDMTRFTTWRLRLRGVHSMIRERHTWLRFVLGFFPPHTSTNTNSNCGRGRWQTPRHFSFSLGLLLIEYQGSGLINL